MMPRGMSRLGVERFLGGERQLLDGEEQPDREGQGGERAVQPNGSSGPPPSGSSTARRRAGADVERVALEVGDAAAR